jgi:hypothetical protein
MGVDDGIGGSVGTAIQMLGVGPHNYYLDLHPQSSFFARTHRRHTNFGIEHVEDEAVGVFGRTTAIEVTKKGDLLGDAWLEVTLPALGIDGSWADGIGYVVLSRVRLVVDDIVIHDHERLWYDLTDTLFLDDARQSSVRSLIGKNRVLSTRKAHTVMVPLKLASCTQGPSDTRQYLPIGMLGRTSKMSLEVSLEALPRCVHPDDEGAAARLSSSARLRLLTDQVVLDEEERRQWSMGRRDLLIRTQQDADAECYESRTATVDLSEVNLPVSSLVFIAYEVDAPDSQQFFRYLGIESATMYLGSTDRFRERPGSYFASVQPHAHCSGSGSNVHMYSFAMHAGARQPSGALNFAVADRPALRVTLAEQPTRPVKIKVFAVCHNWLVFEDGSLGFRFL